MKRVIIPGGGVLHTYTVREALKLGLTPVVTDIDRNCPCAKMKGVEFHQLDCYDVEMHLWLASTIESTLVGAFCAGADTHVVVAAIHEAMGSDRWVSKKTATICKNKMRAKEVLLAAGVPTARFAEKAPCIFKPFDSCGSRGVYRLTEGELLNNGTGFYEELLSGPEQSVEILLSPDDAYTCINIVDRHFVWQGNSPLEVGHTNPTEMAGISERMKLFDLCVDAAWAVGANVGFFKCDTIWTPEGPKVLECTPRLSGGFDSQVSTPRSSGRNLIRYGLQVACGIPADERLIERAEGGVSVTVITRPELLTADEAQWKT